MRTRYSLINVITAWVGQLFVLLFQLASRFVFVRTLSADYLGISGLFTNILSMLTLAELGVGAAMTFSLYMPLVQGNAEKIKSLMRFYRNAYRAIGGIVLCGGIAFLPFYPSFITSKPDISHLDSIYILYVVNSSVSYFYSYKRSLIIADQKKYVDSIVYYSRQAVMSVLQIAVLLLTRNFILYLVCQFVCQIAENVVISKIADKMYPYLKDKDVKRLGRDDVASIRKNVGALVCHKIGSVVVNSTSSVLISRFISLAIAGLYSNYTMITSALQSIVGQAFSAITGSVGNLEASENPERIHLVFRQVFYLNFVFTGFCTICLYCLFQPFVRLWVGDAYLLDTFTCGVIVANFYIKGMRNAASVFRDGSASYYYDRYRPLIESALNLVLSVILIQKLGLAGLVMATIITTVLTCSFEEPFILYRHVLNTRFSGFVKRWFTYLGIIIVDTIVVSSVVNRIPFWVEGGIWSFIFLLFLTLIFAGIAILLSTCWLKEFKDLIRMCGVLLAKIKCR